LLYDPADRCGLRQGVETLVHDETLRTRVVGEAAKSVAPRNWNAVVDELIDVHYAAVLRRLDGAVA